MRGLNAAVGLRRSVLGLVAALLCACSHVATPPPTLGPIARLPDIGESVVSIHARADYAAMNAAANSAVASQVVDLSAVKLGYGVTFKLTGERSDIAISKLDAGVGFTTHVHVDGALDSRCVVLTHCTGTIAVDGRLWGSGRPTINPDWTVDLKPTGGFAIDSAELHVAVFPVGVSVKAPLTKALQAPFDKALYDVDEAVSRSTALKTAAQAAWSQLGKPVPVSVDPPVWLQVHPTRILAQQPTITDQGVELNVAVVARPVLVVGDRPADDDPGPLPDLTFVGAVPDQFSIYLPVRLAWDDATELAQQNLAGKALQAGGGVSVRIDQVSIFNNGDEAGVKIAFHAKTKGAWAPDGTVYFLGTPVYHLDDGYIAIENLHLDVKTRDVVLKLASWLGQQALVDAVESRLHFDMRAQVAARRADLDRSIRGVQLSPQIALDGAVTSLAPSAVYLTREGLQVNVVALGTLKVTAR